MKKLLYIIAITILFASCESYNEQFEGYDDNEITYVNEEIEYTLTDDDYASINSSLTSYLTASYPDSVYLPIFIEDKYPTLDDGSSVTLTYNTYCGDDISYLDEINDLEAESYELTDDDYDDMGTSKGEPGYYDNFSSSILASDYLPDFLSSKYSGESDGFSVMLTYAYYSSGATSNITVFYSLSLSETITYSYELTTEDYDSMGEEEDTPGEYDNFAYDVDPDDYLPDFLLTKYPNAASGDIASITYEYYSNYTTTTESSTYKFDGSVWSAYAIDQTWSEVDIETPSDVSSYILTEDDYVSMGEDSNEPGADNTFKAVIDPENYLATFLSVNFAYKATGTRMAIFYNYETDDATILQVAEYNKTDDGWVETGETEENTSQFMKEEGEWNMVTAELYTMVGDDYQYIVDYVKSNIGESYVDSYGTGDYYYGTSAYYSEFRTKDKYRETSKFDTWQDAVEEAIGTVFLPYKYPDATADMVYIITFAGYYSAMVDYTIEFTCTAEGSTPTFEMTGEVEEK